MVVFLRLIVRRRGKYDFALGTCLAVNDRYGDAIDSRDRQCRRRLGSIFEQTLGN
jgi:hypothetical protein